MWTVVFLCSFSLVTSKQSCNRWGDCYEDPPEQPKPHFWIGKERMCDDVQPSDCSLYGFEYDVSHPRGPEGEKWCFANNKIRCVSPEAPPLADPTPANQLVFASYNIFERNYFISHDGQRERTCRIPRWLAQNIPDLDVITFQEGFMGGCFEDQKTGDLRALLEQHGLQYHTDQIPPSLWKPQPGGAFIASRWPIIAEDQFAFEADEFSWDMLAAKGVSYVKINKTAEGISQVYHVMGTHLSSSNSDNTRNRQAREWRQFVLDKNIPSDEPVLYAGDINSDYFRNDELMSIFEDINADYNHYIFGDLNYTSESIWNDVRIAKNPKGGSSWIDHVMYSRDHLQPISATQQAVHAEVSPPFPVCWCEECSLFSMSYTRYDRDKCEKVVNLTHLSDHNPVVGRFVF